MKITGLSPMLETENIKQTIEFYDEHLGFSCRGFFPDEENPFWVSMTNGTTELMFTTRNAHTQTEKPTMTGSLYVQVKNADAVWEKLKDKVEIVYPIETFEYQMREFGIKDCNGYILNIGHDISSN